MRELLLIVIIATASLHAAAEPAAASCAGNGALTLSADSSGRVTACRWPSPGGPNHLVDQPEALTWGIRLAAAEDIRWLEKGTSATEKWPIIRRDDKIDAISVSESLYVHPERDILAASILLQGTNVPPELFWHAAFAPCTRNAPELPLLNDLFHFLDGFAVYTTDGKTFFHFRPANPGSQEWNSAARLVRDALPRDAWKDFGEGVWIACGSPNLIAAWQSGANGPLAASRPLAQRRILESNSAAAGGGTNCLMAITPVSGASGHQATIYAAFATTREEAANNLQYALQHHETFQIECRQWWERHLAAAKLPSGLDPALHAQCRRDIVTLTLAANRSGAIMCGPLDTPGGRLDWPMQSAWITYALDLAGYAAIAENHIRFCAAAIRHESRPGAPAGSVPLALQHNGTDGIPSLALQPAATAWILASAWKHAALLEEESRRKMLQPLWPSFQEAADFLARWADQRNKEPLPAFDPAKCHDARQEDALLTTYMGVDSALKIAAALDETPSEEWKQRLTELDVLIRLRHVGEGWRWNSTTLLPFWYSEFAAIKLPDWSPVVTQRINQPGTQPALADLCDAALVYRANPPLLATLGPLLPQPPASDTLAAAQHLITAILTGQTGN